MHILNSALQDKIFKHTGYTSCTLNIKKKSWNSTDSRVMGYSPDGWA